MAPPAERSQLTYETVREQHAQSCAHWSDPDAVAALLPPELEPASQMIIAEAELALDEQTRGQIKAGLAARVRLAEPPAPAP